MTSKWSMAVVVGLAGMSATAPIVMATPGQGFTAVQQWRGVFESIDIKAETDEHELELRTKGVSDVYVTRNAVAVDGHSGWHTHPGPSLILVTEGWVMVYDGDDPTCTGTRYEKGEGFVDEGGGHVHLVRNESGAPAETVAVQILPQGSTRRIDSPAPGYCRF
jgi:quercetin dioxygenase-like cupin family protein